MIKAIFFDLDDTLLWDEKSIQEAFKKTCQLATDRYGVDAAELEDAVRSAARELYSAYETYPFTVNIGINPFEGLWGEFLEEEPNFQKMKEIVPNYRRNAWTNGLAELGIHDASFGEELGAQFPIMRRESPFVYEDSFSLLNQLKGKYKLLLLTNGSPHLQNSKLSITPELAPYFDHIVISGDFGRGKPDSTIFEHALQLMGVEADEAMMVGDNLMTDILGANTVGMKTVWINRHNKPRNEVIPVYEIKNLHELVEILNEENRNPER